MEVNKEDFNFTLVCAFRYCLGRRTYAPSYLAEIIEKHKDKLTIGTINLIKKEIGEAEDLGMDCDRVTWMSVLELLEK